MAVILVANFTKNNKVYLLAIFALIFVAGFRYNVGRDYKHYVWVYDTVVTGRVNYTNELGYLWFIKLVNYFNGTQQLVFLVFAILTVWFNYLFIKKYSEHKGLSLLTYVCVGPLYLSSFNQIRQYLAIGVFLLLIELIIKRKFWLYLTLILVTAFFCHLSIILMIPIYFLLEKRLTLKKKLLICVAYLFVLPFLQIVILSTPYAYFVLSRADIEYDKTIMIAQIVLSLIILAIEPFVYNDRYRIFFNINLFSLLSLLPILVTPKLPFEVFQRLNQFFVPYLVIMLPYLLSKVRPKHSLIFIFGIYVFFLSAYYIRNTVLIGESHDMAPYQLNFVLFE